MKILIIACLWFYGTNGLLLSEAPDPDPDPETEVFAGIWMQITIPESIETPEKENLNLVGGQLGPGMRNSDLNYMVWVEWLIGWNSPLYLVQEEELGWESGTGEVQLPQSSYR